MNEKNLFELDQILKRSGFYLDLKIQNQKDAAVKKACPESETNSQGLFFFSAFRTILKVNANALHKILTKYDKKRGGSQGIKYWMSLWKEQSENVSFLHSAIRVQLDAIESIDASLYRRSPNPTPVPEAYAALSRLSREDLICPICLVSFRFVWV